MNNQKDQMAGALDLLPRSQAIETNESKVIESDRDDRDDRDAGHGSWSSSEERVREPVRLGETSSG